MMCTCIHGEEQNKDICNGAMEEEEENP